VLGAADDRRLPLRVRAARVLEQAQLELQAQDPAYGRIDLVLRQQALRDRGLRALEEARRGHHQVVAGLHGERRGLRDVRADPLLPDHPADVVPVRDQRAGEAPLILQHVVEQPLVGGDRYAVHRLVAEHEGAHARAGHPLERRQEPRAQLARADVGLAGVPATLGLGVAGEVLGGGQDRGRVGEPAALVPADHRGAQLADQVRVLAERLVHPAPAQVPRDAQQRREGPVDAGGGNLDRGDPGDPLDQTGVPGRGHRQLGGEDRGAGPEAVPVDAVLGHQQGNGQPGLRGQVHRLEQPRRRGVQDRAGQPRGHDLLQVATRVELEHLPDLLGQRHPAQQVVDAVLDGQ
jgi:hypothetical protein